MVMMAMTTTTSIVVVVMVVTVLAAVTASDGGVVIGEFRALYFAAAAAFTPLTPKFKKYILPREMYECGGEIR